MQRAGFTGLHMGIQPGLCARQAELRLHTALRRGGASASLADAR